MTAHNQGFKSLRLMVRPTNMLEEFDLANDPLRPPEESPLSVHFDLEVDGKRHSGVWYMFNFAMSEWDYLWRKIRDEITDAVRGAASPQVRIIEPLPEEEEPHDRVFAGSCGQLASMLIPKGDAEYLRRLWCDPCDVAWSKKHGGPKCWNCGEVGNRA